MCHAGLNHPLLLLLDGHSFHQNVKGITLARQNKVIIFTLVPHTTHKMQPLDTAVIEPLKNTWSEVGMKYTSYHIFEGSSKNNFLKSIVKGMHDAWQCNI